ncbi:2-amino-4-hydroxy-6-hydroxymethyldihydropteridine diphosphokinase [Methylocapsa sp. S129]|uniref:2-amino-4-hydroxy-6- hydroxymethyldihydropteridine diphosphokinase n=1 Tax=Methylocapsa sp. S129 TaxID=1641869 RepID=UPI00131DABFB|nr:2-amino-4-hydroxy-6-hydroxymethyldihydropteridine diphosphokinase [Methylocapsa sp. S129]
MANDRAVAAFLGLGGNVGDVAAAFIHALQCLGDAPGVTLRRASSVYRTPPWGKLDQPPFLNMAVLVETTLPAQALLALCLDIERGMGRRRVERWGPRTLDIDILTYGEAAIDEPELRVPHPRIAERAFVLAPLAEIVPHLQIAGRDVAQWLMLADRAGIEVDSEASARVSAALGPDNGRA